MPDGDMPPLGGMGWRMSLTLIYAVVWLSFLIIWLFFFAGEYDAYQNLAVVMASLLLIGGLLAVTWIPWSRRFGLGGWRPTASSLVGLAWLTLLIIWMFFYAGDFGIYQNIAIFIVSLLLVGLINSLLWRWSTRYRF